MSSRTHNKKRNVILVYEFLIRAISKALMEDDKRRQAAALKVIRRNFKPGTELYKEFRLANAMYTSTVSTSSVASSIMSEAKTAVRDIDERKLNREKSILIREINYSLGQDVYDEPIPDYTILATIQTLFNEWRRTSDLGRLAEYEDKVNRWLVTEKTREETPISDLDPGTSRLMTSIISRKLNEKYADKLTSEQKEIIRIYALSEAAGADTRIEAFLSDIKERLEIQLAHTDSNGKQIDEIKQMLLDENLETVDDDTITRFMLYVKLGSELTGGKNVQ